MNVTVTLDSNIGADLGPFTLAANTGSISPTQATRQQLLDGLEVTVDEAATSVTVTSTGVCTNDVELTIQDIPIIVAAIVLSAPNTDPTDLCDNGDINQAVSNTIYVNINWDGFIVKNGKLVVNNTAQFSQPDEQVYDPQASGLPISSKSIVANPSTIPPGTPGTNEHFLVLAASLNDTSGTKITGNFGVSTTQILFSACP